MIKTSSLFLFVLFILSSCQTRKKNDNYEKYELVQDHTVNFPMDDQTSYRTFFVNSFQDSLNNELLVFLAQQKPSIQFFDIANQSLYKEIKLSKGGPHGVGSPAGLLMLSWDSIFVVSSSRYLVSLINSNGALLKSYRVLTGSAYNDNTGMLQPYTTSPPVKINDLIYFNVAPDRDVYKPSYFEGTTNLTLDISNGQYAYFNTYPKEFKNGVWGVTGITYSTTFNPLKKEFIYSFTISDSLVVFDPETNKSKRYYAGSRFIKSKIRPMSKPENNHDLEYALETPYYKGIIYDKYRDMYYRFVIHSIPYKDETGEINGFHEKPVSVILLDKDLSVMGETKLPDNIFLNHIYFVAKDGLFISNGNPENPELKEDFAVFTCFKVSPPPANTN